MYVRFYQDENGRLYGKRADTNPLGLGKIIFPERGDGEAKVRNGGLWRCLLVRDTRLENPDRGAFIVRPAEPIKFGGGKAPESNLLQHEINMFLIHVEKIFKPGGMGSMKFIGTTQKLLQLFGPPAKQEPRNDGILYHWDCADGSDWSFRVGADDWIVPIQNGEPFSVLGTEEGAVVLAIGGGEVRIQAVRREEVEYRDDKVSPTAWKKEFLPVFQLLPEETQQELTVWAEAAVWVTWPEPLAGYSGGSMSPFSQAGLGLDDYDDD